MKQRVAVLGSTGSIGKNTLSVIDNLSGSFEVAALTAHTNIDLLIEQTARYKPLLISLTEPSKLVDLKKAMTGESVSIVDARNPLLDICSRDDIDVVVFATMGVTALPAIFAAIETGKRICIANKEPLVMAGELIMRRLSEREGILLPVDSEHSAIFQCINGNSHGEINRIYITGSGGPFRRKDPSELMDVTPEEATSHPRWKMGKKISVDSATMMNKALELVEARWLFDVSPEKLEVIIHPEAAIHSMVEFVDGAVIAQIGLCDMRLPIQYALTYPERVKSPCDFIDFAQMGNLTFEIPNTERFPSLLLAKEALEKGGSLACVMNAANEVAVQSFLDKKIAFTDITKIIKAVMDDHKIVFASELDELLEIDAWARARAEEDVQLINK